MTTVTPAPSTLRPTTRRPASADALFAAGLLLLVAMALRPLRLVAIMSVFAYALGELATLAVAGLVGLALLAPVVAFAVAGSRVATPGRVGVRLLVCAAIAAVPLTVQLLVFGVL
jgi:hypothetical protein